ncbi:Holliday junction resolvase RuvX [Candidatus Kaiserbacteria bacterium]|nr:MAG: Holliday junction resolvase RuvX [Candidatus Kaiserbacteria bacterium]
MRYLGIDYGTKKVGLALSDESGTLAFPHSVVPTKGDLQDTVFKLLETEGINEVVIGHSLDHDGTENPIMKKVYIFKKALEEKEYIVHLEPEFLTTFQAKRNTEDAMADAAAAALILQSFLDKD